MAQPDLDLFHGNAIAQQEAGTGIPLWHNKDKSEIPLVSRVFGFVLILFPLKNGPKTGSAGGGDKRGLHLASLGCQHPDQIEITLATLLGHIVMDEPLSRDEGIIHHAEGVDLVPANIELSGLEVTLVNTMSRETVLREYLKTVRDRYDIILLDCCPSLGMLTINTLSAADEVLIPMQAHYLSIKGLEQLLRTIAQVKRQINPALGIAGISLKSFVPFPG